MDFDFTHFVYNRQGRCLKGIKIAEDASPQEVVDAYLEHTIGTQCFPVMIEDGVAWFGERVRGKTYNRYIMRAFGQRFDLPESHAQMYPSVEPGPGQGLV